MLQRHAPAGALKVDDALDVFAVHGVGGMFGAIATGVFASTAIQAAYSGLLEGNPQQLVTQLVAVGATVAYAVVGTFVIVKVVDLLLGIRVKPRGRGDGPRPRRSTARSPTRCDDRAASRPDVATHPTGRRRLLIDGGRSHPSPEIEP